MFGWDVSIAIADGAVIVNVTRYFSIIFSINAGEKRSVVIIRCAPTNVAASNIPKPEIQYRELNVRAMSFEFNFLKSKIIIFK